MKKFLIGLFTKLLYSCVLVYKKCFSPFQYILYIMFGLQCECCFHPTCSEYALQCLKKHRFIFACHLIIKRLLRCQPFSCGGYDPAP